MNAGTDYQKAKRHAQANADYTRTPRWIHLYNGVWWIDKTSILDAERIDPARTPPNKTLSDAAQD